MRSKGGTLLRKSTKHEDSKVGYAELFFDLVFVFAITQVSHFLLHHLTLSGLFQAGFLTLAIWWVWIFTAWATNWLNPETTSVRMLLFGLMFAGLVMSMSLPRSLLDRAMPFALAYVSMQCIRSGFLLWSFRGVRDGRYLNAFRILIWLSASGVFWLWGATLPLHQRMGLWLGALAIEYVSPIVGFWLPMLGRSSTEDWTISGAHLAERCGLLMIIALGEGLLVTGATFSKLVWTWTSFFALLVAFLNTVVMWWLYFDVGAECASETISRSDDPGELGRTAYTYLHILIVAGVILVDVSDELILAHPGQVASGLFSWIIILGPLLFLVGNLFFKRVVFKQYARYYVVGIVALTYLFYVTKALSTLMLSVCVLAILVGVALWESVVLRKGGCTQ